MIPEVTMSYARVAILALATAGLLLWGQSKAPAFGGIVYDADTKKGIPNLTVKLVPPKQAKAIESATATDAYGNFSFPRAQGGKYLLEVYFGLTLVHREVVNAMGGARVEIPLRTGAAPPIQVTVPATAKWTSTGIDVYAGDTILFSASGQVHWGTGKDEVAGPSGSTRKLKPALGNYPVRTIGAGGLIGKIDDGAPFAVGESTTITATKAGMLYLGINDNYFTGNSGEFQVAITRTAK
jgi:hypothetical protein